jgi:inorganic pyrophosphatase
MTLARTAPALLHRLPAHGEGGLVHVVVDTPMGSRNKYRFDEELQCFKLGRILPAGASFPGDFGAIPQTRAEDGDALDVLLLVDAPSFVGCVIPARLIGGFRATQTQGRKALRNDRLIAVPVTSVNPPPITRLSRLAPARLAELEHFFVSYNAAQGRRFRVLGRLSVAGSHAVVSEAQRRYRALAQEERA